MYLVKQHTPLPMHLTLAQCTKILLLMILKIYKHGSGVLDMDPHQNGTDPQHWLFVHLEQSAGFIEGQAFSRSYNSAPRPPPSPLWGRRRARSRVIRLRESLALYKSYSLVQDVNITDVFDPWHFGADTDPTPDPTPFFSDFKDVKKLIFSYYFHITYPQAHYLHS
jgi:hypothetical protein